MKVLISLGVCIESLRVEVFLLFRGLLFARFLGAALGLAALLVVCMSDFLVVTMPFKRK